MDGSRSAVILLVSSYVCFSLVEKPINQRTDKRTEFSLFLLILSGLRINFSEKYIPFLFEYNGQYWRLRWQIVQISFVVEIMMSN